MEVTLKQHALAALATLVMTLGSGAVLAGSMTDTGRVLAYNDTTGTLSVASNALTAETLQILAGTSYRFIDCPDLFPEGSECHYDATQWNLGRFRNEPPEYFRKLLIALAAHGCNAEYARTDVPDTSGTYGVVSVRPAP
jgi:hypothetical protein